MINNGFITNIFISIIELIILICFIDISNKKNIQSIILNIFYIVIINILNIFINNKLILITLYLVINYLHLLQDNKFIKKNILNISIYNLFKITSIIFVIFIVTSININYDLIGIINKEYLTIILISNILNLVLLKFYLYKKKYEVYQYNIIKLLYFLIVSFSCLCLSIFIYFVSIKSNIKDLIYYSMLFILFCITFIILNIFDSYYENIIKIHKDNLINKKIEDERDYFKELVDNYKLSSKEVHDLKNKLFLIKDLINTDKEEAIYLIDDICNIVSKSNEALYSNNSTINSLINSKIKSLNENTKFDCNIKLNNLNDLDIDILDLLVILGNLLDNSIEYVNKLGYGYIELNMIESINCISINLKNNCKTSTISLQTNKDNKLLHGIGLSSVRSMVNKYNGLFNIDIKSDEFIVEILLVLRGDFNEKIS